jgi:hypothetical protein
MPAIALVTDWGMAVLTSLTAALVLLLGAIPKITGLLVIGWLIAAALAHAFEPGGRETAGVTS